MCHLYNLGVTEVNLHFEFEFRIVNNTLCDGFTETVVAHTAPPGGAAHVFCLFVTAIMMIIKCLSNADEGTQFPIRYNTDIVSMLSYK